MRYRRSSASTAEEKLPPVASPPYHDSAMLRRPPEPPSTIVKQPLRRDVTGKLHAANRTANVHSGARLHQALCGAGAAGDTPYPSISASSSSAIFTYSSTMRS
jgi:hypothetical protein